MIPTAQQTDFLVNGVLRSRDNLALVARAGCGKTSTILLAVDAIVKAEPAAEVCVCAYNAAIKDEVAAKLRANGHTNWKTVGASTIHGLGFGLVKFVFKINPDRDIDDKKVLKLIDAKNDLRSNSSELSEIYAQYGSQIRQLVAVGKQAGVGFFNDSPIGDVSVWHALADHFDINGLEDTSQMDQIVEVTQEIYRESLAQTNVIDYDDMILFPLIKNLRVKFGKDYMIVDEAQDASRARQALARKFIKPGGRMIVVGDDRQAIYGFSGADAAALPNLIEGLHAKVFPLSVTWRCPKAVVKVAQRYVPDIEAAPEAPEGEVRHEFVLPDDLGDGDAILCRNTAPLIKAAYGLIRKGKAAKVEGRAIGDGLIKLVGRWKITTIDALIKRVEAFKEQEVQKAMAKGNEAKAEEVEDKCGTIMEICHACITNKKTMVSDVKEFIEKLFADGATGCIILATYHRSKGREWKRVFLWEHNTRCPSKAAKQDWQLRQEENLAYVAVTRAMQTLVYIN
jgi:DNA helicase II / ATP-dependent DNA helicase PcrA